MNSLFYNSLFTVFGGLFLSANCEAESDWLNEATTYRAAVYEHVAFSQTDPKVVLTRTQALGIMMDNLRAYEHQAELAAQQNTSIIIFPESGLYGVGHTRTSIFPYLEEVTDAGLSKNIPCGDILFPPVQRYLSCIAKNNSMYVVANMGDIRICNTVTNPACPPDGRFQFSTNVVYDNEGKQVAIYHKHHLFNETRFNPAPLAEHSTFKTHFGKFATLIHGDIFFNDTAVYLWWNYKINSVAITAASKNEFPYTIPVVAHRGFSMLFMYNVLSAGLRSTDNVYGGSGLFSGNCGVYHLDLNTTRGHMLIADMPVKANKSKPCGPYSHQGQSDYDGVGERDDKNSSLHGKYKSQETLQSPFSLKPKYPSKLSQKRDWVPASVIDFRSVVQGDVFTMAPLTEHNNVVQVCQGNDEHCCTLFYTIRSNPDHELYVLGAYMGNYTHGAAMFVRVCILLKCRTNNLTSCGEDVRSATTTFDQISLMSGADTIFMLPYVVTSTPDGGVGLALEEFTYLPANFSSLGGFRDPLLSLTLFETYYDLY